MEGSSWGVWFDQSLVCQYYRLESDAGYNREPVEVAVEGSTYMYCMYSKTV